MATNPYSSVLPGYGWTDAEEKVVVETCEYDADGKLVKRTTTTTTKPRSGYRGTPYWGGGLIASGQVMR